MKVLFGSTGLVGRALQEQAAFDQLYSSANFRDILFLKQRIDHLVLCCLPATKWKVNQDPLADLQNIFSIVEALQDIHVERITLISTIDVYGHGTLSLCEADDFPLKEPSYGENRRLFEVLIRAQFHSAFVQVIRLPALFHRLIKKNILFDLIHDHETEKINANSSYQWYPLERLWTDIAQCPLNGTINLFPAPIETVEIMEEFFPSVPRFIKERISYNHRTMHTCTGYWPPEKGNNFALIGDFINETRS
jgi:hypothetical protein